MNMFNLRNTLAAGLAAIGLGLLAAPAGAAPITFLGSQGNLAASATFDSIGGNLIVTLTNTSTADALVPVDILTGVFFSFGSNNTVLTRTSAVLGAGSTVFFGGTDPGGVVGGEWAYVSNTTNQVPGYSNLQGISSSGLGIFGPGDRFPGSDLAGPASPDGLQYGITSAGDNPATGNAAVTGSNALIKNSVVFTLGNFSGNLTSTGMTVLFQYGTALNEPRFVGIPDELIPTPEPGIITLLSAGLLGMGAFFSRRRRSR